MSSANPLEVPGRSPDLQGKVRDLYDLGDQLLLVASDRVSAFDIVLPDAIGHKGAILTSLSEHWFAELEKHGHANHLISTKAEDLPEPFRAAAENWGPRFMLVHKLEMIQVECVVRGYIAGSGWKEYCADGSVCSIPLPAGLQEFQELPEPIFTPSTKAHEGHDENISLGQAGEIVGEELIEKLKEKSLDIYSRARDYARERGILLADTKFEFGMLNGEIILADEVLTPDSSRYWPASEYQVGVSPPSFDKQIIRDYLASTSWDKNPPAPKIPTEVLQKTSARYEEIYKLLTGQEWKSGE